MQLHVDFERPAGRIKPMHAVGQPPFNGGFLSFDFTPMKWLREAGIPYARLHDVGGAFGSNRFVDIPNLFRDFNADENDPAAYDFTFTDVLLAAMASYDVKPIFRLGVTIENQANIKPYRIFPPADYGKWARICEHVIRHYNEGWANGFHYGITYWEIWNEPDNGPTVARNQMWTGTAEQYYELYDVTAKHLKKCFGNAIKVGGYAACSSLAMFAEPERYGMNVPHRDMPDRYEKYIYRSDFLIGFFDYIREHQSPIDFFSWHSYGTVEETMVMADFIDKVMTEHGYGQVETQCNEWNNAPGLSLVGSSRAAAAAAAMMCAMQGKKTYMLCYYDARLGYGDYAGLFDCMKQRPNATYYAFAAFDQLYRLGNAVVCRGQEKGVYAAAARGGGKKAVLIANTGAKTEMTLNAPAGSTVYLLDKTHFLTPTDLDPCRFTLQSNRTVLIRNY